MMVVNNKYDFGQQLYLITDPNQNVRIVTAIKMCKGGELLYELSFGIDVSWHYDFECTVEQDTVKKVCGNG